jgi:glycosyltransferase involved in cell wall biosynthesis
MKIRYINRNKKVGFSIGRVFNTIIERIKETVDVEETYVPSHKSWPLDIIKNILFIIKQRDSKAINHITGDIHYAVLALIGCKKILTIHDLVFLDNVRNPIKRFYKWLFWLYLPIKLADKVVCISTKTKQNILSRINTDKLIVIPNPIDSSFSFLSKSFNANKPVILHIGTGWNKNLDRVINAINQINCHLRIIGKINSETTALLQKRGIDYSHSYGLTDEEILKEYQKCDIVSFPSIYEGFGMPIIEGQQTGRVVLTSRIEPLIEVSGGAVVFVDPLSVSSIQNGFQQIIENGQLRNALIERGLKNVERFAPEKIAASYIELYKEISS